MSLQRSLKSPPCLALLLGLALVVSLLAPVPAEVPQDLGVFHPTNDYLRAFRLLSTDRPAAISMFKQIAADNPGTALGAHSLAQAAYYSELRSQAAELYQAVSAGYPGSRYDLGARLALINLEYGYNNIPGSIAATDALITSFGAPGLEEISRAGHDRSALVARFLSLPAEIRLGLSVAYPELMGCVGWQMGRWKEALPIALFAREAFGGVSDGELAYILEEGHPTSFAKDPVQPVDPQVDIKAPKDGQRKGPRPRFKARVRVGDFRYPQVDIQRLEFLVDGQSRRAELIIRSRVNPQPTKGKLFEKLKLTWRPTQPLAQGSHTIELVVPTSGYPGTGPGRARKSVTFVVSKKQDDKEDERDEDDGDEEVW